MTDDWHEVAFRAASEGDLTTLAEALRADPDAIRATDDRTATLLHVAADTDDAELAAWLLRRGADSEARARWGQTPFEWAATLNSRSVADLLLRETEPDLDLWTAAALGLQSEVEGFFDGPALEPEAGRIPVDGADLGGWHPMSAFMQGDPVSDAFYIACRNGELGVAQYLLDRGAMVDAVGYFGAAALHWAALGGHEDTAMWLVAQGADVRRRDPEFDSTPAGWAREGGHDELAARLAAAAETA